MRARSAGQVKAGLVACLLVLAWPGTAAAEWQIKPFLGTTLSGSTTFVDLGGTNPAADRHWVIGVSGVLVGEVFGIEGDLAYSPGFLGSDGQPVLSSGVTTATANLYVALPRRWFLYTLRPYVVGGGGTMRVRSENAPLVEVFSFSQTLPTWNVGGGATGFVTDNVGVSWELRYFRGFRGDDPRGVSFGSETLAFWRANMALTIRLDRNVP